MWGTGGEFTQRGGEGAQVILGEKRLLPGREIWVASLGSMVQSMSPKQCSITVTSDITPRCGI